MSGRHGGISQNPEVGIPAGLPEGLALCPGFGPAPPLCGSAASLPFAALPFPFPAAATLQKEVSPQVLAV